MANEGNALEVAIGATSKFPLLHCCGISPPAMHKKTTAFNTVVEVYYV